jgi:hypothetical protein
MALTGEALQCRQATAPNRGISASGGDTLATVGSGTGIPVMYAAAIVDGGGIPTSASQAIDRHVTE